MVDNNQLLHHHPLQNSHSVLRPLCIIQFHLHIVFRKYHIEPDILECEVKWALGSKSMNKASGGDGIPAELFQILKGDAVKVLHSMCQQIWKTQLWLQTGKVSCHSSSKKRAMPKNVQTQLSSYHILARECSKSFKLGFNST